MHKLRRFASLIDKYGRPLKTFFFTGRESFYETFHFLDDAIRVAKTEMFGNPEVRTTDCFTVTSPIEEWNKKEEFEKYLSFKLRPDEFDRLLEKIQECSVWGSKVPALKELIEGFVPKKLINEQERKASYRQEVDENGISFAIGSRKRVRCEVWLRTGSGRIVVNGKAAHEFFPDIRQLNFLSRPFYAANAFELYDAFARITTGVGPSAQAQAVAHGIANAMIRQDMSHFEALEAADLLRIDYRRRERKKFGQYSARAKYQWSKR